MCLNNSKLSMLTAKRNDSLDIGVSLAMCVIVSLYFLLVNQDFAHWFIIPIIACGTIVGADGVSWIRGRFDTMDPVGLLGLFGVFFFFLAPFLVIYWDPFMPIISHPDDWRPWLGWMAVVNFAGLNIYRSARYIRASKNKSVRRSRWVLDYNRFSVIVILAIVFTTITHLAVLFSMGGLSGYLDSYAARDGSFEGMGMIFVISESTPILVLIFAAVYLSKNNKGKGMGITYGLLLMFFVLQMLFGGFRGSRSNTIWAMVWALGIVHFWLRPVSRKTIYIGVAFILIFMGIFSFYKQGRGLEGLLMATDPISRSEMIDQSNLSFEKVLIDDLSRSNVQSFLMFRLMRPDSDYRYSFGRTYLAGVATVIPGRIWPNRPPAKRREGTNAQFGMGTHESGVGESHRVYGLAGEAMLNFGPFSVPFVFLLWGLLVKKVRSMQYY